MYLNPLSIPLSTELKMPFLGMISLACWYRIYFIHRVEFEKLVPYGASCYSSNQASFQKSDPFQWEKCSSQVNGASTSQSLAPINLSQKWIVQISASDITQQTWEMHHSASEPFHIHLKHSNILWPKEDSSHTGFCSWFVISDKQRETSPSSKFHNKAKKALL